MAHFGEIPQLRNLIKNSMEASKSANSSSPINLRSHVEHNDLVISVSDCGEGMTDKRLHDLLSGQARTSKKNGHGLGFRFVLDQCLHNEFLISGKSEPGIGTQFDLKIKRTLEEEQKIETAA